MIPCQRSLQTDRGIHITSVTTYSSWLASRPYSWWPVVIVGFFWFIFFFCLLRYKVVLWNRTGLAGWSSTSFSSYILHPFNYGYIFFPTISLKIQNKYYCYYKYYILFLWQNIVPAIKLLQWGSPRVMTTMFL